MTRKLYTGLALAAAVLLAPAARAAEVNNGVLAIGISGNHGSAIDSIRVVGNEVVNGADLGRFVQSSQFFPFGQFNGGAVICNGAVPPWANPQDAGDQCGHTSGPAYAFGSDAQHIDIGIYPREWATGQQSPGLRFETHVTNGPLPYINAAEVAEVKFQTFTDQHAMTFLHNVADSNGNPTPVGFSPAMYFNSSALSRLFGLSLDGSTWTEVPVHQSNGDYVPSLYRFRLMAWMKSDLGYGVGFYSRSTQYQDCHGVTYTMTIASQQGQCPNYAAQSFAPIGTVNLSVIDQNGPALQPSQGFEVKTQVFVGNLQTLQNNVNAVWNAGQ